MNYREEIVKMLDGVSHERLLECFYSLLRAVTSEPDSYCILIETIERLFRAE